MHSHCKYKQMSWEETTGKKKMTDLCLGNVFQLTSRRISRRWIWSGTKLVIFLEAICMQTNLFWREMKILKSNTREENFSTLARHIKCSFLQVCEESGLPVRLFENEFTPQKKKWYVLNLDLIYVRVVNSSYRPHQNERTWMKRNTLGQFSFYSAAALLL